MGAEPSSIWKLARYAKALFSSNTVRVPRLRVNCLATFLAISVFRHGVLHPVSSTRRTRSGNYHVGVLVPCRARVCQTLSGPPTSEARVQELTGAIRGFLLFMYREE